MRSPRITRCLLSLMLALGGGIARLSTTSASATTEPAECTSADLSIREGQSQGGLGSFYLVLAFRNQTRRTCRTGGFSGVTLLGAKHHVLGVAKRAGSKASSLTVAPGATVYEVVQYGENQTTKASCPAVKAVAVFIPDSRVRRTVSLPRGSVYCGRTIFVYRVSRRPTVG